MGQEEIIIRRVNEKDMLTVYELINELEEIEFEIKQFQNIFFNNIKDENIIYALAETQYGKEIGFISCHIQLLLHHCEKVGEIQELFVINEYRNMGIGAKLVAYIEEEINNKQCFSIEVTAQNKRIQAHHFYIKCGFNHTHLKFIKNNHEKI